MKTWQTRIADWWCMWMHRSATWPAHGHYRCRQCWRLFPVPWEAAS